MAKAVGRRHELERDPSAGVTTCGSRKFRKPIRGGKQIHLGRVLSGKNALFVGEGNFSFTLALARMENVDARRFVASTDASNVSLSSLGRRNVSDLVARGIRVRFRVDATRLLRSFGDGRFDLVVFQFPHSGLRPVANRRNPNHTLIRSFLSSATNVIKPDGRVAVTTIESPHYIGGFDFVEAARRAKMMCINQFSFDPRLYPGYVHEVTTNVNQRVDLLNCGFPLVTRVFAKNRFDHQSGRSIQ